MRVEVCPVFDIVHELGWICSVVGLEERFSGW